MPLDWKNNYSRYRHYLTPTLGSVLRKKKARAYTGFVLTLFTICFFVLFALRPTLLTIAGLLKTIEDQKTVSQTLQSKINNISKAQNDYNSISTKLGLLDEALPKVALEDYFSEEIEVAANQAGITLKNVSYDPINLWGFPTTDGNLNFAISVDGKYDNLKQFIGGMLGLRRIIKIESFGFTKKMIKTEADETANVSTEENLSMTIQGKAFFYKSAADAAAGAQKSISQ
jgi:Tfp pilus assembly protein PilO